MNDFESIAQFGQELKEKWLENAVKGDGHKKTFTYVQKQLRMMNLFLKNEWEDMQAEYQKILENKKYTPEYIGKQRVKLNEKYQESVQRAVSGAKATIKELIGDKYKRLDTMLTEPPTPEQMALLQALSMRTDSLSRSELMKILPTFYTNYQSMRIFESIAKTAGMRVTIPIDGDPLELYRLLDEGGKYLLGACDQLLKHGAVHPDYRIFFFNDPKNPGNADIKYQQFIDTFDVPAQLQDYTVEDGLSIADQMKIDSYFEKIKGLDPTKSADNLAILRETQRIMQQHPEDVGLMKRSDYGKYVNEVEELEAINKAKEEQAAKDK